jgi:hypothetical protein
MLFEATTVNVYAVPLVSPLMVHEVAGATAVQVRPPGLAVTMYPSIGAPPSFVGAVHEIVTCPSPVVVVTLVGASGAVACGATDAEAVDGDEFPFAVVATTWNV